MRQYYAADNIADSAPMYAAGVLRSLFETLLARIADIVLGQSKSRITPRHIALAIRDPGLNHFSMLGDTEVS